MKKIYKTMMKVDDMNENFTHLSVSLDGVLKRINDLEERMEEVSKAIVLIGEELDMIEEDVEA